MSQVIEDKKNELLVALEKEIQNGINDKVTSDTNQFVNIIFNNLREDQYKKIFDEKLINIIKLYRTLKCNNI